MRIFINVEMLELKLNWLMDMELIAWDEKLYIKCELPLFA